MTFFTKAVAVIDFNVFFGRHCEKDHITVKFFHDAGIFKGHGYCDKIGNLHIVAAAVGGARHGIAVWMIAANNGIKFTQKSHCAA